MGADGPEVHSHYFFEDSAVLLCNFSQALD